MKQGFAVRGMHCTSCALEIDESLEELEGVKSSRTSYHKQRIEVEFDDSRIDISVIERVIGELGYQATSQ